MSSYFVNSFCGRYPNGPDYQLHNYGDHSSVSEQYRDSASMHSGRYGYGYNGMDLSVGRSASTHFGASERARTYPANSTSASTEPRYSQSAAASPLASPRPPALHRRGRFARQRESPRGEKLPGQLQQHFVQFQQQHAHQQGRGWHLVRHRGRHSGEQRAGKCPERPKHSTAFPAPDLPLDAKAAHKSW